MINKPRQKASKTKTKRISGLISRIQREIDAALKLDLTTEELENLATDQLEHAAALAGDIGQHRNLQVINQELNKRRRQPR